MKLFCNIILLGLRKKKLKTWDTNNVSSIVPYKYIKCPILRNIHRTNYASKEIIEVVQFIFNWTHQILASNSRKQPYVRNRFSLKSSNQKFIASGQTSRVRFSRRVHNCKNVAGKRGRGGCAVKSANPRNNARDFKTNDVNPFCKPRYAIAVLADFIMWTRS